MTRHWELDALRGLMLVLMTFTHLPTRLSQPVGQPFGFVSAAEGFVLLSAFMAGLVYSRVARQKGILQMRSALWRRSLKVYGCHAATLLFLFTVVASLGLKIDQRAVVDLMSFYLAEPTLALIAALLLVYAPPLLDILPMYIVFMLATPWVLFMGLRGGWLRILAASIGLWFLAQFSLGEWLHDSAVSLMGLKVPFQEMGSFGTFSWQLIWVMGLWMGSTRVQPGAAPFAFPRWAVLVAVVFAVTTLVWRHAIGQTPFPANPELNMLFDKWQVGPLRLLNLMALIVILIRFGPAWVKWLPRIRWLEWLGAASLPVFCAHLIVVLLALALFGSNPLIYPWWFDMVLLGTCLAALTLVARLTLALDKTTVPSGRDEIVEAPQVTQPAS
ncbi:MAG: OpgC domain-containing protein [Pseudomonadota bacterium]